MSHTPVDPAGWFRALRDPAVVTDLESIFEYIAAAVESRGPACWASGRCCSFDRAGHRLYVTGLEAAYTVDRAPALDSDRLAAARAAGGCPFQAANLCTVHEIKPIGCRVYFCDRAAQQWQQDLSERLQREVRALHDRHAIDYRYGEWRDMLELVL